MMVCGTVVQWTSVSAFFNRAVPNSRFYYSAE